MNTNDTILTPPFEGVPQIWSKFFMILLVTRTMLSLLGLNQNQIANAQQLQGLQNNQTSSSYTSKQQQHSSVAFDIDNMTFSHHTTSVNGIQLHYVIGGHGPPIVLLHGWPETWYGWHKVMPALAEKLYRYCT